MSGRGFDIPKTMKAVVDHGPGDFRLEELPVPHAGPGGVVIKVAGAGICAGDSKCYHGAAMFWGDSTRKGYAQPPVIPGHEFVGEVVELGPGAAEKYGLQLGDMATSDQIVPCWECRFCRRGQYWQCSKHEIYGFRTVAQGAMAEYMLFPAGAVNHKVPADMSVAEGVMIEPLGCAIHAVQRANIKLGDVVVVSGSGALGLSMIGVAKLFTPGLLIALDLHDHRLEVAKKMGADIVMNPNREDVVSKVMDLTEGYGCDVYIEAAGYPESVPQGLRMIRRLGTFVEFGVFLAETSVDWTIIGDTKELDLLGSHLSPYTYPLAIDYINRGIIDVKNIVTHSLSLEDFVKGLEMVHDGSKSIKVMLTP